MQESRNRGAVILKIATTGMTTAAAIFLMMVATSTAAALLHLPEVYWPDNSPRHNLYGILIILGLVGSILAVPCAVVSFVLYRAARKRGGAPKMAAGILGAAFGAAVALGVAGLILFTP